MIPGPNERKRTRPAIAIALLGVAAAFVVIAVVAGGLRKTSAPTRCPDGSIMADARCCAPGQSGTQGRCTGKPLTCPAGFTIREDSCVVQPSRTLVPAGSVRIGPGDWEAQGQVDPRDVIVPSPFHIDSFEVTVERWNQCTDAGGCEPAAKAEPGQPVRDISFSQAEGFCRWAGGELPSEDRWILAATGSEARRYPWGDTGAVCRRSDWGRWRGPCAHAGQGPEWAGLISEDRTPDGVVGLAGGVAEWARGPDGPVVRGGSWKSRLATELRTWRRESRDAGRGYDDVGFRCVYE